MSDALSLDIAGEEPLDADLSEGQGVEASLAPALPGEGTYDTWLAAGNEGSRSDFLASLQGEPGPAGIKRAEDLLRYAQAEQAVGLQPGTQPRQVPYWNGEAWQLRALAEVATSGRYADLDGAPDPFDPNDATRPIAASKLVAQDVDGTGGPLLDLRDASGNAWLEASFNENRGWPVLSTPAASQTEASNQGTPPVAFEVDNRKAIAWWDEGDYSGSLLRAGHIEGTHDVNFEFWIKDRRGSWGKRFVIDEAGPVVGQLRPGSVNSPDGYGGLVYGETGTGSTSTGKSRVLSLISDEGRAPEVAELHVGRWKATTSGRDKTHAPAASHLDIELLSGDHHEYPNGSSRTLAARFRDDARSIFYGGVDALEGVILTSPSGAKHRLTITDDGTLQTAPA